MKGPMIALIAASAFLFFTAVWFSTEWVLDRRIRSRHQKYADAHFNQTERYRRGIH